MHTAYFPPSFLTEAIIYLIIHLKSFSSVYHPIELTFQSIELLWSRFVTNISYVKLQCASNLIFLVQNFSKNFDLNGRLVYSMSSSNHDSHQSCVIGKSTCNHFYNTISVIKIISNATVNYPWCMLQQNSMNESTS